MVSEGGLACWSLPLVQRLGQCLVDGWEEPNGWRDGPRVETGA